MLEPSLPRKPALVLPFRRAGRSGSVRVWYGRNRKPADGGFAALAGWARERRAGVGFPVIKCEVRTDMAGYWNFLGWLQYVTQDTMDGRKIVQLVDRVPAAADRDLPFAIAGYAPVFFDAPAYNSRPVVNWKARLFLCTVPIMSRAEPILPLVGLTWGYSIQRRGDPPRIHPIGIARPAEWTEAHTVLARNHADWKFAPGFRAPRGES